MDYDIFESDREKAEARRALIGLAHHNGWKFIVKALDANIAFITEQLKDKKDFTSLEEVYYLQERINDLEALKFLPRTILEAIQDPPEEEDAEIYDFPNSN